jgi:bacillithiol system protein YtxJ
VKQLEAFEDLQELMTAERAILFKHSTRCELSFSARVQIERFAENFPAAQVFVIDVLRHRRVSNEAETRLQVRHESPQAILVESGQATQQASHRAVSLETLSEWWGSPSADEGP